MRFRYAGGRLVPVESVPADAHPDVAAAAAGALRPARVIDDLLGWRPDDEPYVRYLMLKYWRLLELPDDKTGLLRRAMLLVDDLNQTAALIEPAVHLAEREGRNILAEYLASVRIEERGIIELPSTDVTSDAPTLHLPFLALAAWCLNEVMPVHVETCENCGYHWLGGRASFCDRPAPGRSETCRSLRKYQTYTDRHAGFHRERTKVYGRKRRGVISADAYADWKRNNTAGPKGSTWVPFDDWKAGKRPQKGQSDG